MNKAVQAAVPSLFPRIQVLLSAILQPVVVVGWTEAEQVGVDSTPFAVIVTLASGIVKEVEELVVEARLAPPEFTVQEEKL